MPGDFIFPSERRTPDATGSNTPLPSERNQPPSAWWDIAKTIPGALAKGALGVIGLPGDIQHGVEAATNYAVDKASAAARYVGGAPSWEAAQQQQAAHNAAIEAKSQAIRATHPVARVLHNVAQAIQLPSSAQLVSGANTAIGAGTKALTGKRYTMYDPQTAAGRITQDVVSSLPAAMIGGPETLAARFAANAPVAVASGLGGGAAREFVGPESPYAPYAQLAGAVLGGVAGGVAGGSMATLRNARAPEAVANRADQLAGQALREAPVTPERDLQTLRQYAANPPPLMAGVEPTTAQAANSPALQALENRATQLGVTNNAPGSASAPAARDFSEQVVASGEPTGTGASIPSLVGKAIPDVKPDMEKALGVAPDMQGDAAIRAKDIATKAETSLKTREQAAWSDVDNSSQFYPAPLLKELDKHLSDMTVARAQQFPNDVSNVTRKLTDKFGATNPELHAPDALEHVDDVAYRFDPGKKDWVEADTGAIADTHARQMLNDRWAHDIPSAPISEIQDLRHMALNNARAAWKNGNAQTAGDLYEVASKIKSHLEDPNNFKFGDEGAADAWSNAVDKTKQYNDAFGSGFAKNLTSTNALGEPAVAGEGTFARMFAGSPDAVQRLRQMRDIPGVDPDALDSSVSDWMMGKLTGNGEKTNLKQSDIVKFTSDPKNAAIIKEVPSLKSKLDEVAGLAAQNDEHNRLRDVAGGFQKAFDSGKPKNLADYISGNKADLQAGMDPTHHDFLDQLENSARIVQKLPSGQMHNDQTIKALQNGTLLSLLYGKAAGAVSDGVAFDVLGHAAQTLMHSSGLSHVGALVGAVSSMAGEGGLRQPIDKALSRLFLGNTRQEAITRLQEAMANPELAAALAQKPSPEAVASVAGILKGAGALGARIGVYGAVRPEAHLPPKAPEEQSTAAYHSVLGSDFEVPTDEQLSKAPGAYHSVLDGPSEIPLEAPSPRAAGGRTGYKSGGAVPHKHVERLVKHLMHKAKKARKMGTEHTEVLLKHDDSTIMSALNAAKRAI